MFACDVTWISLQQYRDIMSTVILARATNSLLQATLGNNQVNGMMDRSGYKYKQGVEGAHQVDVLT